MVVAVLNCKKIYRDEYMSHITVQMCGGLGNQMFQYAMGRALSLRHHVPLILDISWFSGPMTGCTKRKYLLNVFPNIASSKDISCYNQYTIQKWKRIGKRILSYFFPAESTIIQPYFAYWPQIELVNPPAYLSGYWQSEKFFSPYTIKIKQDFTFPTLPEGEAIFLAQKIKSAPNSVAVHIRRGDYITDKRAQSCHGTIPLSFYKDALDYIKDTYGEITIFIFSDNPIWVKEHFDCRENIPIIVNLNFSDHPYHDMHLMSLCKHHVIANSTFSWWGAWLGTQQGLTIAPAQWFADEKFEKYKDIFCKEWIIM